VTLEQHLADARRALDAAGIGPDEARLDAELLARDVLGWDRATFLARRSDEAPPGFADRYDAVISRRALREPVAYIRGEQEFYGRSFVVSSDVLIPRPETEFVIDEALAVLGEMSDPTVVDVGTGSGCLAITIALEHPAATVWATDVSPRALDVARLNAARLGAAERVRLAHGEYFASLPGPFDVIVANPPYIAEADRDTLPPEVQGHEPHCALFGGADGLRVIDHLIATSTPHLTRHGALVIEFGFGQADAIARMVSASTDLRLDHMREDLQRIPRVAVIRAAYTR
jgi:release factor glutamine methyltransferase